MATKKVKKKRSSKKSSFDLTSNDNSKRWERMRDELVDHSIFAIGFDEVAPGTIPPPSKQSGVEGFLPVGEAQSFDYLESLIAVKERIRGGISDEPDENFTMKNELSAEVTAEVSDEVTDEVSDENRGSVLKSVVKSAPTTPLTKPLSTPVTTPLTTPVTTPLTKPLTEENPPFPNLTPKQYSVYSYLREIGESGVTSMKIIARDLGMSWHTIRCVLSRLNDLGLIKSKRYQKHNYKGIQFMILTTKLPNRNIQEESFAIDPPNTPTDNASDYPTDFTTDNITDESALYRRRRLNKNNLLLRGADPTDTNSDDTQCEISGVTQDEMSIHDRLNILVDDIETIYPALAEIGFGKSQIQQITKSWKAQELDLKALPLSLEMADYALAEGLLDGKENKLNYVFVSLKRGPFSKPPNFVSRQERAARMYLDEMERKQKLIEEAEALEFQLWWEKLTPEEQSSVDSQITRSNPAIPETGKFRDQARRSWFRKNHGKFSFQDASR